jgi:hypothetical protein
MALYMTLGMMPRAFRCEIHDNAANDEVDNDVI